MLSYLSRGFFDLVFPPVCPACGGRRDRVFVCESCEATLRPASRVNLSAPRPDGVRLPVALWSFEEGRPVQDLLHQLKYGNSPWIGLEIGARLGLRLPGTAQIVTAVPLHTSRLSERGYNQSGWIALGVASALGIPYRPRLLKRARPTVSQTTLSRDDRVENVSDAFVVSDRAAEIEGATVILVDDTLTTGATLYSCAGVLVDAGARSIQPAAAASAPLRAALEPGTGFPVTVA